jgi:hypothetical protein
MEFTFFGPLPYLWTDEPVAKTRISPSLFSAGFHQIA